MSDTVAGHVNKIVLTASRGDAILLSVGSIPDELCDDELAIARIVLSDAADLRAVAVQLLEVSSQRFDIVVGIYDSTAEITSDDVFRLQDMFGVVIFAQESPSEFLVQLYRSLYENSRDRIRSVSRTTRTLFASAYALRVENEGLRTAVYEASRALDQTPKLVTTATITPPGAAPLEIYPANSGKVIRQRVFRPSRGFCGFDLHFPYPPSKQKADLFVILRSGDNNDILAEWVVDPAAVFGWVHHPLGSPLQEGVTSLVVELRAYPWGHPDASSETPGRISTGPNLLSNEADITVSGVPHQGLSLALRVWVGPPGKLLPYVTPFAARQVPYDASAPGYFVPISIAEKNIGELNDVGLVAFSSKEIIFSVPRMQERGQILLPGIIPARAERAFASIEAPAASGLLIQADVVDPKANQGTVGTADFEAAHLRAFYVGAGSAAPLDVSIPDPDRQFDLLLQFKVLDPKADALEFKLSDLRASWAPSCAKPLRLDKTATESLLDREHVAVSRARRHLQSLCVESPTVELLCPIHRLEDAPRLKANLDRMVKEGCRAVVISHGDSAFYDAVRACVGSAAGRRHINVAKSFNLGYCLNRAIESSTCDYVLKIDADDIYFENFASDLVMWSVSSGASVVGKAQFPLLFEDDDELCYFSVSRDHGFVEQVAGGTICLRRELHKQVMFNEVLPRGTDKVFLLDAQAAGARLFSGDGLNYIHTRGRDIRRHTWNRSNEEFRSADYRLVGSGSDLEMFRG